jgi:hypothetical protein
VVYLLVGDRTTGYAIEKTSVITQGAIRP